MNTKGEDERRFKVWFRINEQEPIMIPGLKTNVYALVKRNDKYAYNFFIKCVESGKITNNEPIEVLYKSIDDVDYTYIDITQDETAKETYNYQNEVTESSETHSKLQAENNVQDNLERNEQHILLIAKYINLIDEESDEESSDSSDTAEIINIVKNNFKRVPKIRCINYVENIVSLYTDSDFKSHFRLSRATFTFLLELLSPQLLKQNEGIGRDTIKPEKTLLLAIWMMATPNSYRCVADRFDVGKGTAWRCVQKVVNALYSHINTFITWPDRARGEEIWTYIKNKHKFPKVIGAIDGTHIKISAPKLHPDAYINRNISFHTLTDNMRS